MWKRMITIRLSYTLKDLKNANRLTDILNSDDLTIEILNADYEDINSLRLNITNTYDVENILRIVRYKMCLKYTDSCNA